MHLTAKILGSHLVPQQLCHLLIFFPYRTCILNIIDIYEAPTEFGAWQVLYTTFPGADPCCDIGIF